LAVTFTGNLGSTVNWSGSTGQHFNCGCMSPFTNDCTIAFLIRRTASARFVTSLLMSSANYMQRHLTYTSCQIGYLSHVMSYNVFASKITTRVL